MITDQKSLPNGDARRTRLDSLTGLRFFAALLIFFHHAWGYTQYPGLLPVWPSFEADQVAVGFFFMLSGFVLAWSLVTDTPWQILIGRRIAKIYPLHLLALTLTAVVLVVRAVPIHYLEGLPSLVLVQAWFPDPIRYAINGPAWSISTELFFYLLFPFVVAQFLRLERWKAVLCVIFVTMVAIVTVVWLLVPVAADFLVYTFPPFRFGEFLLGILLATVMRKGARPRVSLPMAVIVVLACLAIFTVLVTLIGNVIPRGALVVASIPAEALLITSAAQTDLSGRGSVLATKPLVLLGNWSFAFYLLHLAVLMLLRPYAHGPSTAVLVLSLALALTVALSAAAHHFFERPLERLIRQWVERRWSVPARV